VVAALAPPPGAHKNQRQRRRLSAEAVNIVPDACAALAALCGSSAVARAAVSGGGGWPAVAVAFRQVLSVMCADVQGQLWPLFHVSFKVLYHGGCKACCLTDLRSAHCASPAATSWQQGAPTAAPCNAL
jgi:hypothetical protein